VNRLEAGALEQLHRLGLDGNKLDGSGAGKLKWFSHRLIADQHVHKDTSAGLEHAVGLAREMV
jgi:hypothetical protein